MIKNVLLIVGGVLCVLAGLTLQIATVPVIVVGVALVMIAVEQMKPAQHWPQVKGWYWRVAFLNLLQVAVVIGSGSLWDGWMIRNRPWSGDWMGQYWGGLVGYIAITFVFYWWHRARHHFDFLWLTLHQIHHSPARITVITSFYKHPLELLTNGIIVSATLYLACGLDMQAATNAVLLSGLAELYYHWNVRTPHWLSYIIQSPESHRVHHQLGHHTGNFGDLAIWDLLFGTLNNPREFHKSCGFKDDREQRLGAMMMFVDVNPRKNSASTDPNVFGQGGAGSEKKDNSKRNTTIIAGIILVVGLLQMTGDLLEIPALKGLGAATMISPAPKVFTAHKGHETYSARFIVEYTDTAGKAHSVEITPELYGQVSGPYWRRNVYGAVLSYGPVMSTDPVGKPMFDSVSRYALCGKAPLLREIGIDPATVAGSINIRVVPPPAVDLGDLPRNLEVGCQ